MAIIMEPMKSSIKQLTVGQSVSMNDGPRSYGILEDDIKFQSFKWLPEWGLPDWAKGRVFYFTTLGSPQALNGTVFDEKQRNRCAGSIVGAPLNHNHVRYDLVGQNLIIDTDVEDERMEGLCYIEDPEILTAYDEGKVTGCSIDYLDRNPEKRDYNVDGAHCVGLAIVTEPYICGYPDSRVWEATHAPEYRDIHRKVQTMNLEELKEKPDKTEEERAMVHFGIEPEDWATLSEEEKAEKLAELPPKGSDKLERVFTKDHQLKFQQVSEEEPSVEDRVDWLEQDISNLYNQLWTLEENYFTRLYAVEQRITDMIALLGKGQAQEPEDDDDEEDPGTDTDVEDTEDAGTSLLSVNLEDPDAIQLALTTLKELIEAEDDLDDDCYAFIEGGGALDDLGKTAPRELRHLQVKTKDGYCPDLLEKAKLDLEQMVFNGEISKDSVESAKQLITEGFTALGLETQWENDEDIIEKKMSPKTLAQLSNIHQNRADWRRRPFRERMHRQLGYDPGPVADVPEKRGDKVNRSD